MFIGENLTNLRIMHGYSRKQLSEMLQVTEQAVWQYENNYTSPKIQIVNNLKSIFKVKSKYFYEKDILKRYYTPGNITMMNIAYRSKVMNIASKTQAEAKHVAYLDSFVNYITENVQLPSQKIVHIRDEIIHYLNHSTDDRTIQIYEAARIARESLGVGDRSNQDLIFLIEKSGVFIFEKSIGTEIDAYSLWTQKDRSFIILGNLKRSAVRRNFDVAHELGHLLLHYKVEFTNLDRQEHKTLEKEANLFAGAFLLPEGEFLEDMESVASLTNPDAYIDLKQKWTTSLQVLGYRALHLGIFDAKKHRNFYASLHRKGYLKKEPLDESLSIQRPQKVKSVFDFVVKNNLINIDKMIERDWMVEIDFYHRLTGIDHNFFYNYVITKQDFELANLNDKLVNKAQEE